MRAMVEIEPVGIRVMHIDSATQGVMEALTQRGAQDVAARAGHCLINASCFVTRSLEWRVKRHGHALSLFFSPDFPCVAPIVRLDGQWLPLIWSLEDFAPAALAKRLLETGLIAQSPEIHLPQEMENTHG